MIAVQPIIWSEPEIGNRSAVATVCLFCHDWFLVVILTDRTLQIEPDILTYCQLVGRPFYDEHLDECRPDFADREAVETWLQA